MGRFETFEHLADVGIRGYGSTLEEALSQALKALATIYVESLDFEEKLIPEEHEVEVKAETLDELMVFFVNKAISLTSLEGILIVGFNGAIEKTDEGYHLRGYLETIPFDTKRFGFGVEVKGATFTEARVEKRDEGWVAQCVVDV